MALMWIMQISWTTFEANSAARYTDEDFLSFLSAKLSSDGITNANITEDAVRNWLFAAGCGTIGISGSGGAICYSGSL